MINHHPRAFCSRACRVRLAIFEMADIHKQYINNKCCFKLGKTFMETREMLKNVYGEQCMSRTRCYEWFMQFKGGRQSIHDVPHLGRPLASCDDTHVAQVHEIVHSNRHLTVLEIAEECNISIGSCHDILTTKSGSFRICPTTSDTGSERQSHCHLSGTFGLC